jgi:hypothetical protein
MSSVKVAITKSAVAEKLARMECERLASECAKLDSRFEKALAEEGMLAVPVPGLA